MIERFKKMRKELKLTLEDVAKTLGVSIGTVGNWEQRGSIPEARLYQIADKFKVSSDWLLSGEGEMLQRGEKKCITEFTDEELKLELARRMFDNLPDHGKRLVLKFAQEVAEKMGVKVDSKQQTNNGTIGGDMIQN